MNLQKTLQSKNKETGITSINGPVSLEIFIGEGRTIYLFGDVHYSKEHGCKNTVSMNEQKNKLINAGASAIDLDAMFHVWLLYNNAHGIITDVLYERPLSGKIGYTNKLTDEDWLGSIGKLFNPCTPTNKLKYCVYSPTVRIHSIDVRQDIITKEIADIFTWISIVGPEIQTTKNAGNMIKLIELLMANYKGIFVGYTHPTGLIELKKFRNIIEKNNLGDVGEEAMKVLGRAITNLSTTKKLIIDGKEESVRMHRIAAQIVKLEKRDKIMAQAIVEQANIFVDLGIEEANELLYDGGSLTMFSALFEYSPETAMIAYKKAFDVLAIYLLNIGSLGMDIYALARAMYYSNKEIIIYAGNKHIINYIDIINYTKKYKLVRNLGSISVTDTVDRCISDPTMERYLKLGQKANFVHKNKILDAAYYKISDYNINI
jgi:hypothetical protein